MTALGLAFSTLSDGAISLQWGIVLGAVVVLGYTVWGGMWSVALTDLFQSVMIIVGVTLVAWVVSDMAGGPGKVIAAAVEAGKFEFWPKSGTKEWLWFGTAWLTLALGSIPQQDIFQRVTSAKDEKTAVRGTLLGGVVYFTFAFVPVFIVYAGLLIAPSLAGYLSAEDPREMQKLLPALILDHTPMWTQVLFFGALLSAILSTASGALIPPTALSAFLVSFSLAALVFALNSKSTMYDMVQNAYKVTLVGAFVPLAAGIFWKRANVPGAAVSMIFGLGSWGVAELTAADATVPPQLVGLAFSILGMALGSLVPRGRAVPPAPRRTPLI